MILPGTKLMELIQNDIKFMAHNNFKERIFHKDLQFHLSGSDEPGEAETKIFNHISKVPDEENKQTYGIFSPDSDLILMLLCCTMKDNIFLFRQRDGSNSTKPMESISKSKFLQHFEKEIPEKSSLKKNLTIFQMKFQLISSS
jgi:5'-3' exonuclease